MQEKFSILLSLQNKFSFLSSVRPTFGLNRTSPFKEIKCLGLSLIVWDMGGQKKFREEYFKQKARIFTNLTVLYYVFDIQDPNRFTESLDYFRDILDSITELQENPFIIILFNKIDPDIRDNVDIQSRVKYLNDQIQTLNQDRFPLSFYQTTIFDLSTLLKAFSDGAIKGSPKARMIGDYLKDFAKLTFSSAVILMDENSLIVGEHATKPEYTEICETVAPRFITAMEKMQGYAIVPDSVVINIHFPQTDTQVGEDMEAMAFVQPFKTQQNMPFYIITLARNKNTFKLSQKYLPELANRLTDLFKSLD